MNEQTTNQIISGATGQPTVTSFEDIQKLAISARVVVLEDCPEVAIQTINLAWHF